MEKVKAKFACSVVLPNSWGTGTTIHLHAVYGKEGENADYSTATPCGNLSLVIDGDAPASKFFEQGKEYYLDFSKAE